MGNFFELEDGIEKGTKPHIQRRTTMPAKLGWKGERGGSVKNRSSLFMDTES
jgi:hypothetical protein